MAGRTRKMVNLAIEETSGVDHPAHLHEGWLVMKSADESEVQRVLDETLTEEDSTMEETTTATEEQVEKSVEEQLTVAQTRIAELEKALADMSDEDKKKKKKGEEMEEDESMDYMKSAPEPVVKMIETLRKEADEAKAELQKERDARADAEAVEKAKGWSHLNLDAEKVGPALRRLTSIDSDLAKAVEEVLSSLNAQAESANIFAEIGKSADFKTGDAYGRMTAMAKSAVEEGTAKSFAEAMANVASSNPDLYSQYLSEKGA